MENDGANRFVLGYRLETEDVLKESVGYIHRLQELFGTDDDIKGPELQRVLR